MGGIGLLGTDGEGIQFAAPIGDFIQVRAGFTTQAAVFGIADGIVSNSVDDLDGINPLKLTIDDIGINSDGTVIDNLDIEGKIRSNNLQLLFDLKQSTRITQRLFFVEIFDLYPKS